MINNNILFANNPNTKEFTLNDLILLRATFVQELHFAIFDKDEMAIKEFIKNNRIMQRDLKMHDITFNNDNIIDINLLYNKYQDQLKNDNINWAK